MKTAGTQVLPQADHIAALVDRAADALAARKRFPDSTYRLQFHAGFSFRDAAAIVPYLHELGITHVYSSPFLRAQPGSLHGYDISDHQSLNPEIGDEASFGEFVAALERCGMGQILDVVPNHMGIGGNENPWWNDVLESGAASPFASYFDIEWQSSLRANLKDKVLLPVLGGPYGEVLESGQFQLEFRAGVFSVLYFDHRIPIAPCSYGRILGQRLPELEQAIGRESPAFVELQSILTSIEHLPKCWERGPERSDERRREKEVIKRRLAALTEAEAGVGEFIEENLRLFNGRPDEPSSFDLLDELLDAQPYHLSFWRVASDEINYRRFFDVNSLAALSMERDEVFGATHKLIFELLAEGRADALRIDHPDGLYDPRQYLARLQRRFVEHSALAAAGSFASDEERDAAAIAIGGQIEARIAAGDERFLRPLCVYVEKILGQGERLPDDWPVEGTTGYEFLNALNGLFVDESQAGAFTRLYRRWTGIEDSFGSVVYQKKFLIMQVALSSELHMLSHQLGRLASQIRSARDFTLNGLRHALREIIACFPVYRAYIADEEISLVDRMHVEAAVARAKRISPAMSASLFDFVRDMLLQRPPTGAGGSFRDEMRRFAGKFQQVTAPVMAKGAEDTAFYVYNRLLSLNEVGGDPGQFGRSPASFHRFNQARRACWPRSLSATATHDTKRGEDARARLNVLSEIPREWQRVLGRWRRWNRRHRVTIEDAVVPDRNEEYFLYQTLVGGWPNATTADARGPFVERVQSYVHKAIHEAKVNTSWINPNPAYEEAMRQFVSAILDPSKSDRFLADLTEFATQVGHWGRLNSLSQLVLKLASPGVPDIYQGTELWDDSFVDPDNRRPVDYVLRRRLLERLAQDSESAGDRLAEFARDLAMNLYDGRVKLYVTWRGLRVRRRFGELFAEGDYTPAETFGERRDNLVGFVRRHEGRLAVAAIPRLPTRLGLARGELPLGEGVWRDTVLVLPGATPESRFRNTFTGEVLGAFLHEGHGALAAAELFRNFPVALVEQTS